MLHSKSDEFEAVRVPVQVLPCLHRPSEVYTQTLETKTGPIKFSVTPPFKEPYPQLSLSQANDVFVQSDFPSTVKDKFLMEPLVLYCFALEVPDMHTIPSS